MPGSSLRAGDKWIGLRNHQSTRIISLLPRGAIRRPQRKHIVVVVVLHLQRAVISPRQAAQVAVCIVGKAGTQASRIGYRNGATEVVVLKEGDTVERINLAKRQLVPIKLDHAQVAKRVDNAGLA